MALCTRRRSLGDCCFHGATGRSCHSSKAPLMCRTTSFVIVITIIIKTYELNVFRNLVSRLLQTRRGGPGLTRMLRVAFCSRQRTPLLFSLYLLTVHVVLLLCLGGYLWNQLPFFFLNKPDGRWREDGESKSDTDTTQAISLFYIAPCDKSTHKQSTLQDVIFYPKHVDL